MLSASATCVIFTTMKVLNTIARWKLESFQALLQGERPKDVDQHDATGATRQEMFHIMSSFFNYVGSHDDALERLPAATSVESTTASFSEFLQFGPTYPGMPRIGLPPSCFSAELTSEKWSECTFLRAALHELILLMGYLSLCAPLLQEIFSWGKDRPLLCSILSYLPMPYFSQCRHLLFPTLAAIVLNDCRNRKLLEREMDLKSLLDFLNEEFESLPQRVKAQCLSSNEHSNEQPDKSVAAPKPQTSSWAEMDDDEEVSFAPPPVLKGDAVKSVEKERLAKSLKSMLPSVLHFRIDRRIPVSLWLEAISFLSNTA
jgi:hypothetical protein